MDKGRRQVNIAKPLHNLVKKIRNVNKQRNKKKHLES